LYSTKQSAFLEDHARIVGSVSQQIGKALEVGYGREAERSYTPGTSLITSDVERVFASLVASNITVSVACIQVALHGDAASDTDLWTAALRDHLKAILRSSDLLFEVTPSRMIALLPQAGPEEATALGRRIAVLGSTLERQVANGTTIHLAVGTASRPQDGGALLELIQQAHARAIGTQSANRSSSVH
jgi:hypothetical protein